MRFTPIRLAFHSLRHQKARTLLTMLAISIGITAVIVIMAAGRGIERLVMGQLEIYQSDMISIEVKVPNGKKDSGNGPGSTGILITTLKDTDLNSVLKNANVLTGYGMVTGQEIVSYQDQIKKVLLMGHGASMPEVERFTMKNGRFFSKDEEESLAQVAVLGTTVEEKLFGDENPVGKTIYIKGKPFRVTGTIEKRGAAFFFDMDNLIVLPTKTMQKKLLGIDYMSSIVARLKDEKRADQTKQDLEEVLRINHGISDAKSDDFSVHTMAEAQSTIASVASGLTFLLVALVCISLVVGGVGIMNIMYVSVAERTFEIGLRKALGARYRDILWQFLSEALMITLGGGVVGVVTGALFAFLIYWGATAAGFKWVYSISWQSIVLAVGFSAFIGLIFGLYPARKAAALNPIDALRKE